MKAAASFELVMTLIAVSELLVFVVFSLPHVHASHLSLNAFPHGVEGIFVALPFAIWFFLGIEGVANLAEETVHPQRNIYLGFGSAMITIVFLCISVFISAVGIGGWEKIVFSIAGASPSNSPLPLALIQLVDQSHFLYKMLVVIGLIGLIASFHGLILAGSRATYEFGRVGFAPKIVGRINPTFNTPVWALLINMLIGIIALCSGKTGELITISCFGALSLYIIAMIAMMQLRRRHPDLHRPFKTPLYPLAPYTALLIAIVALIVMTIYNLKLSTIYFGMLMLSLLWFKWMVTVNNRKNALSYEAQP